MLSSEYFIWYFITFKTLKSLLKMQEVLFSSLRAGLGNVPPDPLDPRLLQLPPTLTPFLRYWRLF